MVVGCGYLGKCVAKNAILMGDLVWGTTRQRSKFDEFQSLGIEPLILDWTQPETLSRLPEVDRILISVSYDRQNHQSRRESQVGGLHNLLGAIPTETPLCYISTTGVYHQTDGQWVDEESPAIPTREGGQVHLEAEQLLEELRPESPWTVLRLAGIYGPNRVPRAADVTAGRPIASPPEGYLNLIHVEDASTAVLASWSQAKEKLYVVADDEPVVRGEFYREIARQTQAPEPKFIAPNSDAPVTMRSASNKRIRNKRMRRDLVPNLRFPTFREGLEDVLGSQG
jgi:nucleoside-diphosphate-sugar epimerase